VEIYKLLRWSAWAKVVLQNLSFNGCIKMQWCEQILTGCPTDVNSFDRCKHQSDTVRSESKRIRRTFAHQNTLILGLFLDKRQH
jgi:hypothetical protein